MQTHAAANISGALAEKKNSQKKERTHMMCTHVLPDVTKNTHQNTAKRQEAVIKKTRGETERGAFSGNQKTERTRWWWWVGQRQRTEVESE